jgi:lysophospholipase L1-like esterase
MKLKPFFLSLSVLACAALAVLPAYSSTDAPSQSGPAATANVADETPKAEPRAKDRNWVARQTLLNERAQAGGFDVMFLGDSITHSWEPKGEKAWYEKLSPFRPQNFGISGDQTSHVLWRLQNGNLDGKADPKLVVLMIGTNDTGSRKPAQRTANGVKAILDEIQKRKPAAKILLLAVFPRGHLPTDGLRVKNDEINTLIAAFADNQKIFFKDINKIFLTEDGKLERKVMPDFLHPNADSYALWADAIVPDIKAILGADYTQGPVLQVPPPPAPTAPPAESRVREKYWKDRQVLLNQRAQDGGFDVMFIGDSITHNWEEDYLGGGKEPWAQKLLRFKPANFGIGADQTGHVLWRLQNGNLDGKADPKVVVLMIGTNDTGLGRKAPARTALGVKAIIDEIHKRKPAAKILLLGIFPRSPSATSAARVTNNKINDIIKTYADDKVVFYKDIGSLFLEEDGKISLKLMPDKLHLTTEGYHLWADAIIPDIEKLLAK